MVLLGDIGQRQEVRERPCNRDRVGHGELPEIAFERAEVFRLAASRTLGSSAHPLHRLEQPVALTFAQRVAK